NGYACHASRKEEPATFDYGFWYMENRTVNIEYMAYACMWNDIVVKYGSMVSAVLSSQGFNELDGLRHRIPSPMASAGLTGWSAFPQEYGNWQL
ncbi:hypothetical protein Tco_1398465, partial [Tanacetum coccineum]